MMRGQAWLYICASVIALPLVDYMRKRFTLFAFVLVGAGLFVATRSHAPGETAFLVEPEIRQTLAVPPILDVEPEPDASAVFTQAMMALGANDRARAFSLLDDMDAYSTAHATLLWALATDPRGQFGVQFYENAMRTLAQWPGQAQMQINRDRAMARGFFNERRLIARYKDDAPQTFDLAFELAKAHLARDDRENARAAIIAYWHEAALLARDEQAVIAALGDVLTKRDHQIRYFAMMGRDRVRSGERLKELAGWEGLHSAFAAVIRGQNRADALLAAVPDDLRQSVPFRYANIENLRLKRDFDAAAQALDALIADDVDLLAPDAWWSERRIVARALFEDRQSQRAYGLVAAQTTGSDEVRVDAQFHAGWIALRGLDDAALALSHFEQLAQIANGSVSLSRAYYWQGRSHEALGAQEAATAAYARAAAYSYRFYGQLAAARLGLDIVPPASGTAPNFTNGMLVSAARLLAQSDAKAQLSRLFDSAARDLTESGVLNALIDEATKNGDHFTALRMAKVASERAIKVGDRLHPDGIINFAQNTAPAEKAMAYAIARQESEFNSVARSGANAQGIMQLLPGTAEQMARTINVDYDRQRLATDPHYNALLGLAYIRRQLQRFDGSNILALIAYNAGPGRAQEWAARFGDPDGRSLEEVVDWIETIPFPETRNYVQRVIENLTVYQLAFGIDASIRRNIGARRS